MRAHKNLRRADVCRFAPEKIAQMAASEFLRAAKRLHRPEEAVACLERARELMGILETRLLPEKTARRLRPLYHRCARARLLENSTLSATRLPKISAEAADELTRAFL
jgi:hypothetical protein